MKRRILLSRCGWMKYYSGSSTDDPRPIGGGSWNKEEVGSELCNFKRIRNVLYGCVSPPGNRFINLKRIDKSCEPSDDHLDGVTVIFVACNRAIGIGSNRQTVVGWYRNATVSRQMRSDPTRKRDGCLYNLRARAADAVLLPSLLREHPVPRSKPGTMGQSNVWYEYDLRGNARSPKWLAETLAYVESYRGENLVTNPAADLTEVAQMQLESAAGFESDARIRRVVEERAMEVVRRYYKKHGYYIENKSRTESYDFSCTKNGRKLHVEVKGTTTLGEEIILTPNEVRASATGGIAMDLCVVHSIHVTRAKDPKANGGKLNRFEKWNAREHQLRPISYLCRLKPHLDSQ